MKDFQSKYGELPGTSLDEIVKQARHQYHVIQKKSPRRLPYVRSRYFTKDKIFINNFWEHLNQKPAKERIRRLRLYSCAIDLLRNSTEAPDTIVSNVEKDKSLHRFYGQTNGGARFCVQIKENKRTNRKEFISVFPIKNLSK